MDLDNMKKTWQQTSIKPQLEEDKIQQMLDNKGKGALDKLLRTEKIFLWMAIIILPLACLLEFSRPFISLFFIAMLVPGCIWQIYKIRFLKKIDTLQMGIVEISAHINRYKKYLLWEITAAIPILIIFMLSYTIFLLHPKDYSYESLRPAIIMATAGIIITIVICIPIYLNLYLKNIRDIERSIQEIKYFEEEND